jgi:hypothetical protein
MTKRRCTDVVKKLLPSCQKIFNLLPIKTTLAPEGGFNWQAWQLENQLSPQEIAWIRT